MDDVQRLMVVFGTRPEAIKLAPIINAARADARFEVTVVNTGQHKEMLVPILEWFDITPDYTLDVMAAGQPLAELTGKLLNGLHKITEEVRPDTVVIQGDTTTAYAGALAAYYGYDYYVRQDNPERVKDQRRFMHIAHVEAGLRTGDNYRPFPEEGNRKMIGQLATYHFPPTMNAAEALFDENILDNVYVTGNTVIDALFATQERVADGEASAPVPYKDYVLITGHRRESYGAGFEQICDAIKVLAEKYFDTPFVYPVHFNQHVQKPVQALLGGVENVHLIEPLDYPQFVAAMMDCKLVLTDSGGVQEEAPSLGKPVLVMREVTERPEAIIAGTAKIVGTSVERIVAAVSELMDNDMAYARMANAVNPYGDGLATGRILDVLAGEEEVDLFNIPRLKSAEIMAPKLVVGE